MERGILSVLFLIFFNCSCSPYKPLGGSLFSVNSTKEVVEEDEDSKSIRILEQVGDRSNKLLDSLELHYGREVGCTMSFLNSNHSVLRYSLIVYSQMFQISIEVVLSSQMLEQIKEQVFAAPVPGLKKVLVTLQHKKLSRPFVPITLSSYD